MRFSRKKVRSMISFNVDGVVRTAQLRVGLGSVRDVIIGFHGSASDGAGFISLNWGPPDDHTAIIAPDSLLTPTETSWVIPGLPDTDAYYPPSAPSDQHDLNLLGVLVESARRRWPGARIWFVGASKGASVGWAAYAYNVLHIDAYFLAIFGAPKTSFYGWGFGERMRAGLITPKSVALWHGGVVQDVRSQNIGGADTWANTTSNLATASKAKSFGAYSVIGASATEGLVLRSRDAQGGVVPYREYEVVTGTHVWRGESAHAKDFFGTLGYGT